MEVHLPAPHSHVKSLPKLMNDCFISPGVGMTYQMTTPTSAICFIMAVMFHPQFK